MTRALERRAKGSTEVVWIYVEHCDYGAMPFARLEGMPKGKDGRLQPLIEFNQKDQTRHLADASRKIREIAEGIVESKGQSLAPEAKAELKVIEAGEVRVPEGMLAHAEAISADLGVPADLLKSILANLVRPAA